MNKDNLLPHYTCVGEYCADNNCRYSPIDDFPGYYVTTDGNVYSDRNQKLLMLNDNGHGYLSVQLYNERGKQKRYIHRLVAKAFVPNDDPEHKTEVDHLDGDKTNNHADNLQWLSRAANIRKNQYRPLVLWNIAEHRCYGFIGRDAAINYLNCSKTKLLKMITMPNLMCRDCVVAAIRTKDKEWQVVARDIPIYILEDIREEMVRLEKELLIGGTDND